MSPSDVRLSQRYVRHFRSFLVVERPHRSRVVNTETEVAKGQGQKSVSGKTQFAFNEKRCENKSESLVLHFYIVNSDTYNTYILCITCKHMSAKATPI